MSIGTAFDVALGLILTYLLLGMLASSFQELFVSVVKLRGKKLSDALDRLLDDGQPKGQPQALAERVKAHGLLKPLGAKQAPSYLPAKNFALALIDCVASGGQAPLFSQIENGIAALPALPLRTSLESLVKSAAGDLDALQGSLQSWFDDAMDRVSGEYKRFSQYFLLAFGLFVAVVFNIDSIHIATTLWTEPSAARAAVVQAATTMSAQPSLPAVGTMPSVDNASASAANALAQLQSLPIPIGWIDVTRQTDDTKNPLTILYRSIFEDGPHGLWRVLGWILTAFGVSLGAPFWFGTLQQFMGLRAAGPKPARSST